MVWSKESRQSRGYGPAWEKARVVAIERDMGLCQPCKAKGQVTMFKDVDHKVPKAEARRLGWSDAQMDHPDNLQCICAPCHLAKSAKETGRAYRPKRQIGLDGWPVDE